eukprot:4571131-Alexandrium_andersonii.AAC.1
MKPRVGSNCPAHACLRMQPHHINVTHVFPTCVVITNGCEIAPGHQDARDNPGRGTPACPTGFALRH